MNKTIFISVLLALFALEWLEPVRHGFITPFTEHLAAASAGLLKIFDPHVTSNGIVIQSLSNGTSVAILAGCNGIEAMICLTAATFAYPATWTQRLWGLLLGYLAIQSLNIVRIISLFYLLQWDKQWFEWAHLYIWQGLIFLDVLIVFIIWIRWVVKSKLTEPQQPLLRQG